ncbi:30S ribosomal protein S12 methylthiotransferase RimO [candidate division KSB1 bacterium]
MSKKVKLISLGCPKNDVDSEVIGKILSDAGYDIENDINKSSVIFINTCGFIGDAKNESVGYIVDALDRKRTGEIEKVYVSGCLVKRFSDELKQKFNGVDKFFSVEDFNGIRDNFNLPCWDSEFLSRLQLTPEHYAYLKISEGCDYSCSFCVIPSIRGTLRSRSEKSLIEEANILADNGVKELILVAEDTTSYGNDLSSGEDLSSLLTKLTKIQGIKWLRILYIYPKAVNDKLIDVIASSDKICNYFDMPIQHISDEVLKNMNRTYRRKNIENIIEKLRMSMPGVVLRTSVIVGFPGESKNQFVELSDFLMDNKFERLGVFKYSDEKDAASYGMQNKINETEITERYEELRLNQDMISDKINQEKIWKTFEVLIDSFDREEGCFIGRTYGDAPSIDMVVKTNKQVKIGEFTNLKIKDSNLFEIFGE